MLPDHLTDSPVITLARDLLGRVLASQVGGERVTGVITETEAYLGVDDPASHAWQGKRRKGYLGVWSPPGSWYVYRSYGIHWCLDLTADPEGVGGAVLLRAVEPLEGLEVIRRRRGRVRDRDLTNGPGKLGAAFGVTGEHDGLPATDDCIIRLEGSIPITDARRTLVTLDRRTVLPGISVCCLRSRFRQTEALPDRCNRIRSSIQDRDSDHLARQ